jgi:hypothetical protein
MSKISRAAFLYSLGATGVFILSGCGSGTEKNTTYGGAYRSAYTIPQLNESGVFAFTVDIKGNLTGTLDNQVGKVREVSGSVDGDGTFEASTRNRADGAGGRFTGSLSSNATVFAPGAPPAATPIVGGTFSLAENNTTVAGSFTVVNNVVTANNYRASYSDGGRFNPAVSFGGAPRLSDSRSVQFNVDQQGLIVGSFGPYPVEGRVADNAQIAGNVTTEDGNRYAFRGIINKLTFRFTSINAQGEEEEESLPGISGDLIFVVDGKEYAGSVNALGGDGTTQ